MAKPATVKKPALAKPTAKKPAAKLPAKKPAAAKPAKPPKEVKPFTSGEIVIFQGYAKPPESDPTFTQGEQLAVLRQRLDNGVVMVACVKVADYHKALEDENAVDGEELMASEVKRTNKTVPAPYHLPVVGEMATIIKQSKGDPREQAVELWNNVEKSFFYLGGVLNRLYKEKLEDGKSVFTQYQNPEGKNYEDSKEGLEAFCRDSFGHEFGGSRKALYLMGLYETVSELENPEKVIRELPKIGWWKAATLVVPHLTNDNADELMKDVQQKVPYDKLKKTIETKYTTAGGTNARGGTAHTRIRMSAFNFRLFEDQALAVETILAAAKKQTGVSDDNQLFEHIVSEWAGDHLGDVAAKAKQQAEKRFAKLRKEGVKIPENHPQAAALKEAAE